MKIKESKKIYIALNKPKGYVCALKDNLNLPLISLIKEKIKGLHIVGRLDKDTTGLIILTNDGHFTHKMTHPKKHITKRYLVTLKKPFSLEDKKVIEEGMFIDHGKTALKPGTVKIIDTNKIELSITEGKFHQIKKMMFALNNEVKDLKRIAIGNLTLDALNINEREYIYFNMAKIFYN